MPKVSDELFFEMTMMFIDNILKTYDVQDVSEESKLAYLKKVVQYCEHTYDHNYEPKTASGADGRLLLLDKEGNSHDVAYRGIWSVDQLKDLMAGQFSLKPDDLHFMVVHDSFSSVI